MNCEEFKRSIKQFEAHPILYQRLIKQHLENTDKCVCDIKED